MCALPGKSISEMTCYLLSGMLNLYSLTHAISAPPVTLDEVNFYEDFIPELKFG